MDKELVCNGCFRVFMAPPKTTWLSAERMRCPFCGCRDTSPMLEKVVGKPLLVAMNNSALIKSKQ